MDLCYAVIDVGTNTSRLMLADDNGRPFEKRVIPTRIGDELQATKRLSEAGMRRTIEALDNFKAIADHAKAKATYAFATSAVRDADNRAEFLQRCQEELGIVLDVVSGEEEAQLAFRGAVPSGTPARIVDIGGGSTELSAGKDGQIRLVGSVPFGAVRAAARYTDGSEGHIQARRDFRATDCAVWERGKNGEAQFSVGTAKTLLQQLKRCDGPLYGVGGTITSIAALAVGLRDHYDAKRVHGYALTHAAARKVLQELGALGRANRERIPVLKGRADIICFGGAILLECMDAAGATDLIVSDSDNMEGYLLGKLAESAPA